MFSLNLTVGARGQDVSVRLAQRLDLVQRGPAGVDKAEYAAYRSERQDALASALRGLGHEVDSKRVIELGEFDPRTGRLYGAAHPKREMAPQEFLSRFLEVSLICGHFRENKGYQLAWLPPRKQW